MKDGPMLPASSTNIPKKSSFIIWLSPDPGSDKLVIVYGATRVEASSSGDPVKGLLLPSLGSFFTFVFGATHGCQSQQPSLHGRLRPGPNTSVNRPTQIFSRRPCIAGSIDLLAHRTPRGGVSQMINIQSLEADQLRYG